MGNTNLGWRNQIVREKQQKIIDLEQQRKEEKEKSNIISIVSKDWTLGLSKVIWWSDYNNIITSKQKMEFFINRVSLLAKKKQKFEIKSWISLSAKTDDKLNEIFVLNFPDWTMLSINKSKELITARSDEFTQIAIEEKEIIKYLKKALW